MMAELKVPQMVEMKVAKKAAKWAYLLADPSANMMAELKVGQKVEM
jgi:hypothetical protein